MCNYFLRGNNAKKKAMELLVSRHVAIKSIKENLKLFFSLLLEVSLGASQPETFTIFDNL